MYCVPLVIFYQKKVQPTKRNDCLKYYVRISVSSEQNISRKNAKKTKKFTKTIGDEAVNVDWAKKTCGILCSESSTLEALLYNIINFSSFWVSIFYAMF